MHTSHQISDWILSKVNTDAGDTISPLKLQKLLYYCQAWHLTVFSKPIFDDRIEAWAHGPVVPSEYRRFSNQLRNEQILIPNQNLQTPSLSKDSEELLNEVLSIYGEHSASYLEQLTHEETPWIEARKDKQAWERSNEIITHKSMKDYYSQLHD